jgi:hypothetical protein
VCAFDFDLTLRIPRKDKSGKVYDWDAPGYESQEVLQACQVGAGIMHCHPEAGSCKWCS